jgi:hypothetical protein
VGGVFHTDKLQAFLLIVSVAIISRKQAANRVGGLSMVVVVRQRCVSMVVADQHVVRGVVEHLLLVGCRNEDIE